jgi:hypothetical protein
MRALKLELFAQITALLDDSTTVTLSIAAHLISSGLDKAIEMPFTKSGRV